MGPSGYDHQVAGKCASFYLFPSPCIRLVMLPRVVLLLEAVACFSLQQADIRVAGGYGLITISFAFELTLC